MPCHCMTMMLEHVKFKYWDIVVRSKLDEWLHDLVAGEIQEVFVEQDLNEES